jgi:hypothetical protein
MMQQPTELPLPACGERVGVRGSTRLDLNSLPPLTLALSPPKSGEREVRRAA